VARNLVAEASGRVPAIAGSGVPVPVKPVSEIETRYYLRVSLMDEPGMLGRIASILGEQGISIASVVQKEAPEGGHVPVVIVTHEAQDRNMTAALETINKLDAVGAPTVRLRIEAP
jgi:homoserine dehydrogenase